MTERPRGAEDYQALLDGGMTLEEVELWKQDQKRILTEGGLTEQDAAAYFGEPDPAQPQEIDTQVADNYTRFREMALKGGSTEANPDDPWEMLLAGWGMSATSLGSGGGMPSKLAPEHAGFFGSLAMALGQAAGDLPAAIPGFIGGAAAGGAAGGAAGAPSGPGAFITGIGGAVIGAGAGAAGAPELVRQLVIDSYVNGEAQTWAEVAERGSAIIFGTAKQAAVGAITAPIGGAVGGKVLGATGSMAVAEVANNTTQAVAGTALFGAMEGRISDMQDFTVATAMVLGFSGAGAVVGATKRYVMNPQGETVQRNMMEVYSRTGMSPLEQAQRAEVDPAFKQDLMATTAAGEPVINAHTFEGAPEEPLIHGAKVEPESVEVVPPKDQTGEEPVRTIADHDMDIAAKEEPLREKPMGAVMTVDHALAYLSALEGSANFARANGISEHDVVSHAGAVGRYQIMPNTARQYGFDPTRLRDPEYNRKVATAIVKDLTGRYRFPDGSVDFEAVAIAYNAGPGRANKFRANGRDPSFLPKETKGYIARAEKMGAFNSNHTIQESIQVDGIKPYSVDFKAFLKNKDIAVRRGRGGQIETDPNAIASYLQNMGRAAGFRFVVGNAEKAAGTEGGPAFVRTDQKNLNTGRTTKHRYVWMPDTPDETTRRWYGLGRSEILFHEVGHALDSQVLKLIDKDLKGPMRDEMEAISRKFRPQLWTEQPAYNLKPNELRADAIAAWLSHPEWRKEMPLFNKMFADQLAPYLYMAERNLPAFRVAEGGEGGGDWKPPPSGGGGSYEKSYQNMLESIGGGGSGGGKPPGPPGGTGVGPVGKPPPKKPTFPLTEEMLSAKIEDMIAKPDRPSLLDRGQDVLDSTVRQVFSELAPFRKIDSALRAEGTIDEKFFGLEDSFRMTYSSAERAAAFMEDGTFGVFDRKLKNDASLHGAFKVAKKNGGTKQGFVNYMLARRSLEKAEQGIETTSKFTPEEAARFIELTKGKYEEAAKTLQKSLDGLVDYMVESGRLSKQSADNIKRDNRYYIPFQRHVGGEVIAANVPRGRGFAVRQNIKEMEGSQREIVEPMAALVEHYATSVTLSDRNVAIRNLISTKEFRETMGATKLEDKRPVNEYIGPDGKVVKLKDNASVEPDVLTALELERGRRLGASEFIYYNDGVPEIWSIKDPEIAKVLRGTTRDEGGLIRHVMNFYADIQRKGITDTVDFVIRQAITDSVGASVLAKTAGLPFQNLIEGFWGAFATTPGFKQFAREGGLGAALSDMDKNVVQLQIDKIFNETNTVASVSNFSNSFLETFRILMERTDAMGRYGHDKRMQRMGYSPAKAAMEARKARLDFKERGTSKGLEILAGMTPFLRPRLLGMKQLVEQLSTDPAGVALRASMYIVAPTILVYLLHTWADEDRDERDPRTRKNTPRWIKDKYWVINLPGGEQIRIPKPQEAGFIFGSPVERFLDYSHQKDPKAFEGWALAWLSQLSIDVTPAAPKPVVEHALGVSSFTWRPINPPSMEEASGYMKFTPATTETAKALSRLLGPNKTNVADISGPEIENYVRGWTGSLGMQILKTFDYAIKPENTPRTWVDNPFLGSFFIRAGLTAQPVTDFYDTFAEVKKYRKDLSLAAKRGDEETLDRVLASEEGFVRLDSLSEALANIRQTIQLTTDDPEMTVDEKRQIIDQLSIQGVGIAMEGNKVMGGFKK